MKSRNIEDFIFDMFDIIVRHSKLFKLIGAAGLSVVALLLALALKGCASDEDIHELAELLEKQGVTTTEQQSTEHFGVGEHIVSVPIKNDIRSENVQYDYFPGYEPVGISINAYGKHSDYFGGGSIIYSNIEEVDCSSVIVDKDGNYLYLNFGTPTFYKVEEYDNVGDTKIFNVGEHIISVPISEDNRYDNFQYDYIEGYEVVGMATSTYGKYNGIFAGGVLLYKNTVSVECTKGENGYTSFGTPVEKGYTKKLN